VIAWFIGAAVHTLNGGTGAGTIFSMKPIFNAASFHWSPLFAGTAVACFSFLGFDAISTLAEETKRPARAVSIATVSSLLLITGLFLVQVYFSALLVPNANKLTNPNTAFYQIFGVAGGSTLSTVLTVALIAACLANAIASLAERPGCSTDGRTGDPEEVFGYLCRSHRRQFSTSC